MREYESTLYRYLEKKKGSPDNTVELCNYLISW